MSGREGSVHVRSSRNETFCDGLASVVLLRMSDVNTPDQPAVWAAADRA